MRASTFMSKRSFWLLHLLVLTAVLSLLTNPVSAPLGLGGTGTAEASISEPLDAESVRTGGFIWSDGQTAKPSSTISAEQNEPGSSGID